MGKKRADKGARRGARGKGSSPRDQRGGDAGQNRAVPGAEMSGPSRLLLTRLVRDGAIWQVYIATTAQAGASNVTQLEFEGVVEGQKRVRYARPLEGELLEALHSGAPVSRARLEEELELAFGE